MARKKKADPPRGGKQNPENKQQNSAPKISEQRKKDVRNDVNKKTRNAKVQVPPGWIQRFSKSHPDRQYFFNTESGKSVWSMAEVLSQEPSSSSSKIDNKQKNEIRKRNLAVTSPKSVKRGSSGVTESKSSLNNLSENLSKNRKSSRVKDKVLSASGAQAKPSTSSGKTTPHLQSKSNPQNVGEKICEKSKVADKANRIKISITKSIPTLKKVSNKTPPRKDELRHVKSKTISKESHSENKPKSKVDLVTAIISSSDSLMPEKATSFKSFKIPKAKESTPAPKKREEKIEHKSNAVGSGSNRVKSVEDVKKVVKSFDNIKNSVNSFDDVNKSSSDLVRGLSIEEMDWEDSFEVDESGHVEDLNVDNNMLDLESVHQVSDSFPDHMCGQIVVVDTNLYISHLTLVVQILETQILAVPWAVLKELDGLKNNSNEKVAFSARKANRWIVQQIKEKNGRIMFQKRCDYTVIASNEDTPDDRILLYCLYLKDSYGDLVTLVTNDTNLQAKALIEEIDAKSSRDLQTAFLQDRKVHPNATAQVKVPENTANSLHHSKLNSSGSVFEVPKSNATNIINNKNLNETSYSGGKFIIEDCKTEDILKIEVKHEDRDTEDDLRMMLTCLTHVWLILTVISQGLRVSLGLPIAGEHVSPNYPVDRNQAPQLCRQILQYVQIIGQNYEALMSGEVNENTLASFSSLLNNFKKELGVMPHEAWKFTPIVNSAQVLKFFQFERLKVVNGFQQLVKIREDLMSCNEALLNQNLG